MAASTALNAAPLVGPSTLGQLLQVVLGNDTTRQQDFANLLVSNPHDTTALWVQVEQSMGTTVSAQLQLLGQLAFLTSNNAPLLAALYQAQHSDLKAPVDLVTSGYYEASAWTTLLSNVDPPAEVAGATLAEQKANYADLLAAQVRLNFPTATVGQLATNGALGKAAQSAGVGAWLTANQANFDIGDEPISQFLTRTGTSAAADVVAQVTSLQRVYQVAPDATSMGALLSAGLDSAYAITKLGQDNFVTSYSQSVGGDDIAQSIFARAQTVTNSTRHIVLSYLAAKRARSPASREQYRRFLPERHDAHAARCRRAGHTRGPVRRPGLLPVAATASPSPAPSAYLVDLLDWIDNTSPASGYQNPQTALLSRRPDIGTLPLTCDNTNIALPYIDLVNETLEYFVGNAAPNSESLVELPGLQRRRHRLFGRADRQPSK